jgi:hypothetical protein
MKHLFGVLVLGCLCGTSAAAQGGAPPDSPSRSDAFLGFVIVLVALGLYFLPGIVGRRKRNSDAIWALNLFLGWTLLGWIAALVWALTKEPAI